jgi:hypothetical protein
MSSRLKMVALSKIMIEAIQRDGRELTVLRRHGDQSNFDITEIAHELTLRQFGDEFIVVLFDWSRVGSWPFSAPSADATREWKNIAPPISRAALVHCPRLTRHAAILAALMRLRGVAVRSFRPPEYDRAVEWLAGGL